MSRSRRDLPEEMAAFWHGKNDRATAHSSPAGGKFLPGEAWEQSHADPAAASPRAPGGCLGLTRGRPRGFADQADGAGVRAHSGRSRIRVRASITRCGLPRSDQTMRGSRDTASASGQTSSTCLGKFALGISSYACRTAAARTNRNFYPVASSPAQL